MKIKKTSSENIFKHKQHNYQIRIDQMIVTEWLVYSPFDSYIPRASSVRRKISRNKLTVRSLKYAYHSVD